MEQSAAPPYTNRLIDESGFGAAQRRQAPRDVAASFGRIGRKLVGLVYVAVALVEIFLVGFALTTWPLWRRLKKLEREHDEKAREILERWRPVDRREPS